MIQGARYRALASGSVFEVEHMGTSLVDPCILRCVEIGAPILSELGAWAQEEQRGLLGTGDSELANIEHALSEIPTVEERLEHLKAHTMARRVEVEPAWFDHAAEGLKAGSG